LPHSERNLLFRKVLLSHPNNPPFLVMSNVKNPKSRMDQEAGRTSITGQTLAEVPLTVLAHGRLRTTGKSAKNRPASRIKRKNVA